MYVLLSLNSPSDYIPLAAHTYFSPFALVHICFSKEYYFN